MPTPAVELVDITKAFPGVVANDHISLRAMPGEVLCLLGENGAGKSTLMSILSGLYQPDSGSIRVDGRDGDHPFAAGRPCPGHRHGLPAPQPHPHPEHPREHDAGLQRGHRA